jgi:DNA-3-methyladenine glycosylase I
MPNMVSEAGPVQRAKSSGRTRRRCPWGESGDEAYRRYHDDEWGVPVRDDRRLFEFLVLESAQAGLAWSTILNKRDGYARAFAGFDPERVARFNRRSVERLLGDAGIVRNRLKIESAISNARRFLALQETCGSFSDYLWDFVDGVPVQNRWRSQERVPASTPLSDRISKDLKSRGFRFVGSTIVYAYLQATGVVNDHLVSCFRHAECARLA